MGVDGWRSYRNGWLGLSLDVPADWRVVPAEGVAVNADPQGLTSAVVRMFQLGGPVPSETLARRVVAALREVTPSLQAWIVPAGGDIPAAEGATVLRIAATVAGTPVEGLACVQATERAGLVTGYTAPVARRGADRDTLRRVLGSVRFGDPVAVTPFADGSEGSYSGYAPTGWNVRAALWRSPTAERIPLLDLRAADPTGTATLVMPPQVQQFPLGPPQLATARVYLSQVVLPWCRREHPGCAVDGVEDHPELARREQRRAAPGLGVVCDASSMRVRYPAGGTVYVEQLYVLVTRISTVGLCTAAVVQRRRAPAGSFEEQDAYFAGITESITPDPGWQQREDARAAQVLGQAYTRYQRANADYAGAVRHLGQVRADAAGAMRAGAHRRWNEFERVQQDLIMPALRGEQLMVNPRTGDRWSVPLRFGSFWADGADRVYLARPGDGSPAPGADRLEPI